MAIYSNLWYIILVKGCLVDINDVFSILMDVDNKVKITLSMLLAVLHIYLSKGLSYF